jgi:4-hydroxybenzoate polyprenyltransferase
MSVLAYVKLARPQQWVKNAFVLPGLVFGHALEDPEKVTAALLATLAFCLMSSAVYAMNDLFDRERDREHPDKRGRPIASGEISVRAGALFALMLGACALAIGLTAGFTAGFTAGPWVVAILAIYALMNLGYSLGLKRVPVVDVFIIAAGFMLRILAGTVGIGIEPSRWLLLCGFLVTLFLGFAKRRAELIRLADDAGKHRPVLDAYTEGFLDTAIMVCATGMVIAYGFYTVSPDTLSLHGTDLTLTLPFVLFGTFRYLFLLRHRGGGGDPSNELLDDRWLLGSAAGWAATVVLLIG